MDDAPAAAATFADAASAIAAFPSNGNYYADAALAAPVAVAATAPADDASANSSVIDDASADDAAAAAAYSISAFTSVDDCIPPPLTQQTIGGECHHVERGC